jgi:hypothetical protein
LTSKAKPLLIREVTQMKIATTPKWIYNMSEDYEWKVTPLSVAVHYKGESPHFGESTIVVSTDDEAGGAFITLRSHEESLDNGHIRIDMAQLELIVKESRKLIKATK